MADATRSYIIGHDWNKKERTGDVTVTGDESEIDFRGLHISPLIVQGLNSCGFKKPSPVQLESIPLGKCGYDLLIQAKSGTGKTCVFTVIALESLDVTIPHIQVVILNPAREIALQNASVAAEIGSFIDRLLIHTFIGGIPLSSDIVNATECHIAVATPGRLVQLIREGFIDLSHASLLILDEADKLTEITFFDDVQSIVTRMSSKKQVIAASATYPSGLDEFIIKFMKTPKKILLDVDQPALLGIRHVVLEVQKVLEDKRRLNREEEVAAKYKCLLKILKHIQFTQAMIFCQYQLRATKVYEDLCREELDAKLLSARMAQKDRIISYNCLRWGTKKIIVCTDLCARGLDSESLDLVINFELPLDLATYQHRVGRAGRFGSLGTTINLIAQKYEFERLKSFQNHLKVELSEIDSIATLVRLGEDREAFKELRRLGPSLSKSAPTGLSAEYMTYCVFGSEEDRLSTQIARVTAYIPNSNPEEIDEMVQGKLTFVDQLIQEVKFEEKRQAARRATKIKAKEEAKVKNNDISSDSSDSECDENCSDEGKATSESDD